MNRQIKRYAMRKVTSFLIGLLLFTAVDTFSTGDTKGPQPLSVGMVALLATPQKYTGKVIRTWGFLNLRPDNNGLWLHEADLQASLWKDSFALDLTEEQEKQFKSLNQTYVMVEGTLHSKGPAGTALNSGTFVHILLVSGWQPFVPFEPKTK